MNNKKFFIVVGILVLAAVIGLSAYLPSRVESGKEARMADFPKVIGDWQGSDMELSKRDFEILETTNLIMREYKNSKTESVYLYIVYSGDNRNVVHPPEICYTGGGATIIEKSVIALTPAISANKFVIEEKDTHQLVAYWFKSTDVNTYDYFKQQLKVVVDRMLRKKTSGALIRISTRMIGAADKTAVELVKSFAARIEPLLAKYVP